jgi:mycothione reductase
MKIHMNTQAEEVRVDSGQVTVVARDRVSGRRKEFAAAALMIAVGRRSNADLLKVENTGVKVDKRGYIEVDEYLETGKQNIFAVGDANGQQMFLHVANQEAAVAWYNATHKKRVVMDYNAAPHALFTHPQVASVGLTEEAAAKDYHVMVGRAKYFDTAKGEAMMEESGFAKAVVDAHGGRILGFHIVGPHAPILIQEVINAMAAGGRVSSITRAMHIHPALPEVIERTFENLEDVKPHSH